MSKLFAVFLPFAAVACGAAPHTSTVRGDVIVALRYLPAGSEEPATEVVLDVTRGADTRSITLGRFGGACSQAQYRDSYGDHTPRPSATVGGTVCYLGGADIVAITRDGGDLVVSASEQSDAAQDNPGGEGDAGPVPPSPWRELARVAIGADTRVVLRPDAVAVTPAPGSR
jgi:hypothetical protein